MESHSPERRGIDRRFLARLPAEVHIWQDQGIITPNQGRAIVGIYPDLDMRAAAQRARGRLVTILAILGSVLVGLGVILFFASNWNEIPRPPKLALIITVIAATYITGYWLRYRRGYHWVGTAVIFLATLFYGAGIHLVAQVYHHPVNDPDLVAYWFLGVLPLAYVTRSQPILVLGVGLFLAAVAFRLPHWLAGAFHGEIIAVFALYLPLGLLLYGLGKLQAQFRGTRAYATIYELVGLGTVLAALYVLTFRALFEPWEYGRVGIAGDIAAEFWLTFFIATGLAVGLLVVTLARRAIRGLPLGTLPYEGAFALVLLAAVYLVVFLPVGGAVVYPIVFNVLLVLAIIGLVFAGYFQAREALINAALLAFIVDVVTRYFEFSWTLFDRSLVFILAGAILLLSGFLLERGRRQVLERMRQAGGAA